MAGFKLQLEKQLQQILKDYVKSKIRYKTALSELETIKKKVRNDKKGIRNNLKLITRYEEIIKRLEKRKAK